MDDHKFMGMKIVFIYNIWLDICMLLSLSIFFSQDNFGQH